MNGTSTNDWVHQVPEPCGIAVVRAWRSEDRLLIRIVTDDEVTGPSDTQPAGVVTDSVEQALDHLQRFLRDFDKSSHR